MNTVRATAGRSLWLTWRYAQTLSSLNLANNRINAVGAKHIAEALKVNTVSSTLFRPSINTFSHIGTDVTPAREERSWSCRCRASCCCTETEQRRYCLMILIRQSVSTQKLTSLDLQWNLIRAEGAQHLASALKENTVRSIKLPSVASTFQHKDTHVT